ncbi:hypothetical protein [Kitasatospora sp. NPDC048538]|uniref:hypothetical protein n=1 Tax=unclassified Kitasatospora TaxID=2633591 RepID=UPI0033D34A37
MRTRELRAHAEEIGFTPQEQTRWLAPRQLARTAVKVVLATVFADYADKREIQGALSARMLRAPLHRPDAQELWFDFVADLGDGFDATGSVAWALAAPSLTLPGPAATELPRGALLVLGGDEVYPTASARDYEDKTKGPYRAALPTADDEPLMVALPGNHDWYDGLTAFLRVFAQQRPIGGWRTRQTRSYFVVQLPRRWWLVGLDSQLGEYFDDPQLRYFETHLSANLQPGDGVIVCSAEPTWVKSADKDVDAFNALHWFDRNYVRTRLDPQTGERTPTDAAIRLWLTGDRHHYARYAERLPDEPAGTGDLPADPRRRQLVTCGLGGAYLAATHRLPAALPLPPAGSRLREKDDPPPVFDRARTTHPDAADSRRISRGLARPWSRTWLPRRNPGFAELTAGVHAVLFLLTSFLFALAEGVLRPVDAVRTADAGDLGGFVGGLCGAVAVLFAFRWAYRLVRPHVRATPSTGLVSVLVQVAVALVVLALCVAVPFPADWSGWAVLVSCLVLAGLVGGALGSEVFALWVLSARHGAAAEWQMSGQSVEEYKGFLRLHLAPDGDLTLYPLTLDRICRDWRLQDDPSLGRRPVPARPPTVRLIEEPVVVARAAGKAGTP